MGVCDEIGCEAFPCRDVNHGPYHVPSANEDAAAVAVILVSEAVPADPADGYEAPGNPLFARTTVEAFRDAGFDVSSMDDIGRMGVHVTTAVKCAKTGYTIDPVTIRACSELLERELALFPRATALLLMGDVAIRSVNEIARRSGERRVVPAGATYKIRGQEHNFRGLCVFPSYLQAGPSFYIEKKKRRMIAEDIAAAMRHAGRSPAGVGAAAIG